MATYFPQPQNQLETRNPLRLAQNYGENLLNQQKMGMFQQEMQHKNSLQQQAQQQADRQHKMKIYKMGLDSGNADFLKELMKREFPDEEIIDVKMSGGNFETIVKTPTGQLMQIKSTQETVNEYWDFVLANPQLTEQEVMDEALDRGIRITEYKNADKDKINKKSELTLNQKLSQTRQFYNQRAKQYLDPLTGFVKAGLEEEHASLMEKMDEDLAFIDKGKKAKWVQGLINEPVGEKPTAKKEITEDIVADYLKKFKGDIAKAEEAARKDGYDF